ncbi:hypothetical protein CLOSBL3_11259 [Clostridiaceae bacterium BL-3]|nr:hypothetical protein CLOSBL3_11259 [Clostridiaceae bacterium BL-3]
MKVPAFGISFSSINSNTVESSAVEFEDPFGNRLGITDYTKK